MNFNKGVLEAGCDEAGRGCLAGPVVAAAVILPPRFQTKWVNDSKKLTAEQREEAAEIIKNKALAWAVGVIDHAEIDKINILRASFKAMHQAVELLSLKPESLLIDGNRFYNFTDIPHHCIVKGDGKIASIAAASILAKTHRDALMKQLHVEFPNYGWERNMGYGTRLHYEGINKHGITPYHRLTYAPIQNYVQGKLFSDADFVEMEDELLIED
ncbi:MAG: ribonuclease HII [Bacteroidia bacterium]